MKTELHPLFQSIADSYNPEIKAKFLTNDGGYIIVSTVANSYFGEEACEFLQKWRREPKSFEDQCKELIGLGYKRIK